jgi:dissimilatory sulfite reductase (desulfoviridin) alpha/beta subunit
VVCVQISDTCRSCYKCQKSCPSGAISITNGKKQITYEDCNFCGNCLEDCGHINVKGKQKSKTVQK